MTRNKRLIRISEVIDKTGYCRAWIYRLIKNNEFPEPIKIGPRSIAFVEKEIDEWIDDKIYQSRKNKAA